MAGATEEQLLAQTVDRLSAKFSGVPVEAVAASVRQAHSRFEGRPVRDFVPLLVERIAGQNLRGLAGSQLTV